MPTTLCWSSWSGSFEARCQRTSRLKKDERERKGISIIKNAVKKHASQ
jgi:hypothetical protein